MRRTKIVATIGPASCRPDVLERLIRAGVNVVRLNFSHGDHEGHRQVIEAVRALAARTGEPIAILQDLSGPKIRIGTLEGGGPVELRDGARVTITTDDVVGTADRISTTYKPLPRDVKPGERILLDDGNLELRVVGVAAAEVECAVVHGGPLRPHKGMNIPEATLSTPALTEKDRRDLAFGLAHGVDYVALSFVRQPKDLDEVKAIVRGAGKATPVIAKIEKREAVQNLESVLAASEGVMVARGDLGVELSTEEVPTLQKRIIALANTLGKVVITATQMLESMIENPRPTRAEASDVANAILDGTDAVMLSAESASGAFPVPAVETMSRIAVYTENHYDYRHLGHLPADVTAGGISPVARSLARVATSVAEELSCKLIVAFTESGLTAQLVSCFRPRAPIAAITYNEEVFRRLALWWGVIPVKSDFATTTDEMIVRGEALLKQKGLAAPGDRVLMLGGMTHTAGATNMIRIHTVA
jgi:pyruvate kinase